jgi:DNA-damage-inducible protein J
LKTRLIKSTEVRLRIEPRLKVAATAVLAECGLSVSEAIRLFMRQVVAIGGLPFAVRTPNAETRRAMQDVRAMKMARFHSAQALFNDLEKSAKKRSHTSKP